MASEHPSSGDRGRPRRVRIGVSVAVIATVLFVALVILKPAMPDRIVLLTGPEGSAYDALGRLYAGQLDRQGIEVTLVRTLGGLDNVKRLASGEQDAVGFAPSVIGRQADTEDGASHLVSLGSIAYEPLWLFYRSGLLIERIPDLAGLVVATGGTGSVSDFVARELIETNGVAGDVKVESFEIHAVDRLVSAFDEGSIDAVILSGPWTSPVVRQLLETDGLTFLSFERADAYAALIPGVTTLVAPEGVFDLARNQPPRESRLLSATTNLVTLESLHPAVAPLLLDVASGLPDAADYFKKAVDFPNERNLAFPLDHASKRYFQQGETGLSKHLPYKVTRYLNHLGFVVLPLLGLAILALKLVPAALRIWGSIRLTGLLKQLEAVEKGEASGVDRTKLLADLDRIDRASAALFVPRSTVHDYIDFRQFLHDMRERVERGD